MSRRRKDQYSDVQYQLLLPQSISNRFNSFWNTPNVPWKALGLATVLFLGGTAMLIVGSLIVSGTLDTKYSDRLWPMIIIGLIMFIPGAYHMRIAYGAFLKQPGYSFDDIPDFE